jgi:hypothetical protein
MMLHDLLEEAVLEVDATTDAIATGIVSDL